VPEAPPQPSSPVPATARLFVAVAPPPSLVSKLEELSRPALDWIRWTTTAQWLVTLRFLGRTQLDHVPTLLDSLRRAAENPGRSGVQRCCAQAGPAVERLGRQILCVPVAGLERLAGGVEAATAAFGELPERRPYRGHLTIARARGNHSFGAAVEGAPMAAPWEVTAIDVLQSHQGPGGSRYEVLGAIALR
jgi:2'-5' RNA ligase